MSLALPSLSSLQPLGGVNPLSLLSQGSALSGQYDDSALLTGKSGLFGGKMPIELPSLAPLDILGLGKASAWLLDWLDKADVDKYAGFAVGTVVGSYFAGDVGGRVGGNLGAIIGDQAGTDLAAISQRLWA